jgi:Asp/Glu/hydantoin racemase
MSRRLRFLLTLPFALPADSPNAYQRHGTGTKEETLMNHAALAPLLADIDWDLDPGPMTPHGNWPVETREEFMIVGAARLPRIREACEGGRYDAIVMLGGGDPGYVEGREIARRWRIPVTANAHAQMHVAGMLGSRFSVIDVAETHNAQMAELVVRYRMTERCASIRNIDHPLPRPVHAERRTLRGEAERHARGEASTMLDAAVAAAGAAIEEDGAEVLILGCSAAFWLRWPLQERLLAEGWDVPVLEGYSCAIAMAKLLVGLGVDASGLAFPGDPPSRIRRWRRV